MSTLTVKMRGVISLALPDEGGGHARAFFPRRNKQRLAYDNEYRIISPYFPYVAVPQEILPEGAPRPDLVCDMYLDHYHPIPEPESVRTNRLLRWESILRSERAELNFEELPEKATYCVYFAADSTLSLDVLSYDDLTYNLEPVYLTQEKPDSKNAQSLNWLVRLDTLVEEITNPLRATDLPKNTSTYLDLTKGRILPTLHVEHTWRFLHSKCGLRRPVADEVVAEINTTEYSRFTIRPHLPTRPQVEIHVPPSRLPVILGNEPIEDIVGVAPILSCADPGYDFELQYSLVDTKGAPRRPVPLCVNPDEDHLSPPGARCGPPVLSGGTGGG
jgi:hypothetical protein